MVVQKVEILLEGNWKDIKRVLEEIDDLQQTYGKRLTFEVNYDQRSGF